MIKEIINDIPDDVDEKKSIEKVKPDMSIKMFGDTICTILGGCEYIEVCDSLCGIKKINSYQIVPIKMLYYKYINDDIDITEAARIVFDNFKNGECLEELCQKYINHDIDVTKAAYEENIQRKVCKADLEQESVDDMINNALENIHKFGHI